MRRLAFVMVWLWAASAAANGRMPGANDVIFSASLPDRLITRATYGILESDDRGASWRWICEQAIDVSGVISDPPLGLLHDGSEVLLPPTGSALVSKDHGCSWTRAGDPLAGKRGTDLTVDPQDPARMLVLTSTLRSTNAMGYGSYENQLIETRGESWQLLATLPTDLEAETVEIAHSDAQRIYVSGSDAANPRLGVMLRSEDGGATWLRSTLELPAGTGSLWISGIHPTNPDRLWLRVAARGDTLGLLPARLYTSDDKGATFRQLATTNKGMFGFALSPDGAQLAYGGPFDGMFVGPSDGSAFVKRNSYGITCLRWPAPDTLYACGSEPADPFSVGVSRDQGATFAPLFRLADTCPAACAAGTSFAMKCETAWSLTETQLLASRAAPMCGLPWSVEDAGVDAGVSFDAGTMLPITLDASIDAGRVEPKKEQGCALAPNATLSPLLLLAWLRRRRR